MVGAWPTVRNELAKSLIIKDGAKVRRRYFRKSTYQLQPVRQVRIPKAGKPGEFRMLGIRTIYDRVCQQALLNRLEPIFEPIFDECQLRISMRAIAQGRHAQGVERDSELAGVERRRAI